ncbi:MAG: OmpA family protein [Bacteroidota bacterium]
MNQTQNLSWPICLSLGIIGLFVLTSCVPKDQYDAAVVERNYYQNLVERNDSIRESQALSTYSNTATQRREIDQYIRQIENLTATNQSLNRSFQDLQNRYQTLLDQNNSFLDESGSQVGDLQRNLAERDAALSEREQELRRAEIALQNREAQLNQLENSGDYSALQPAAYGNVIAPTNQQAALAQNQVQSQLSQALSGYSREQYYLTPEGDDRLRLTVSELQLFTDGYRLSANGQSFLQSVANTLRNNDVASIVVVGHEDPQVDELVAFENSTDRAISIVRFLRRQGLSQMELTAGGQGGTRARVPSTSQANQAINRRTDLIIQLLP